MWGLHVHAVEVHHGVMMTVDLQSAQYAFTSCTLSPVMSKKRCSKRNPNGNQIWMLVNSALSKEQMSFYLCVETFEKADSLTVCRRAFQSLGAERWLGSKTVFHAFHLHMECTNVIVNKNEGVLLVHGRERALGGTAGHLWGNYIPQTALCGQYTLSHAASEIVI